MNNVIQQISLGDGHSLYLIDYEPITKLLTFRTSRIPEHLQREIIIQNGEMIHTNLYKFHVNYLNKFMEESNE
jgi:hypothetical protein